MDAVRIMCGGLHRLRREEGGGDTGGLPPTGVVVGFAVGILYGFHVIRKI